MNTNQTTQDLVQSTRWRVLGICFLLLLASAVNYMDRQTLSVVSKRITSELGMNNAQYGNVEAAFGFSFAFGGLLWGVLVDRFSVRWIYPIGLTGWSLMGFLTGFVNNYDELLWCRGFLGFFESAHWPCGLKATHLLLTRQGRAMGNSVLQSGTSIGAILTPLIMMAILTDEPGSWRVGFQGIAVVGSLWVFFWLAVIRRNDFVYHRVDSHTQSAPLPHLSSPGSTSSIRSAWWHDLLNVRFALVVFMVIAINTMWQLLRAWLPKILQENYEYSEQQTLVFNSAWFAATDVGCFVSGAAALYFATTGFSVKTARMISFGVCTLLCGCLTAVPWLDGGPLLLAIFFIAGAGALGVFPIYYSFAQDISKDHPGKVTSIASTTGWIASSIAQVQFGAYADATKRFDYGLFVVGVLPILPFLAFLLLWPREQSVATESPT